MDKQPDKKTMRLTEDVVNPKPDRRARHNWRLRAVWKKGLKLIVETFDSGERYGDGPSGRMVTTLTPMSRPFGDALNNYREKESFYLIMAKLEPVKKTVAVVLAEHDHNTHSSVCTDIFKWMIETGKMTIDEFEAMVD